MRERLLLTAATLAAFGGALAGSFHFDDYSLFSLPLLTGPALYSRPLTYLTFWLNEQLGGREPIGYHLVNLALHCAVVLLLWDVLRRLIPPRAALVAALIFAIHPIQSEPVAYIFARPILLAALFCLLSAKAWIGGRRWLAVIWFAVALLGKEEAAAFPLVLWMLERGKRWAWNAPLAAMLALSIAAGLRVMWATRLVAGSGAGAGAGVSPLDYFAAQGASVCRYLRLVTVPWGFTVDPQISSSWLAWLLLVALAFAAWKWGGEAGVAFLAALVLLVPSSSLFPAADLAADRRIYLPMLALAAAIGLLLCRLSLPSIAALALLLVGLSIGRMTVWHTEQSLWEEAVLRSPTKVRPKIQLARVVPPARALEVLGEARSLAPDDPLVASEAGRIYLTAGRPAEALAEFGRALALDPRAPRAFNNRGTALAALGQVEAARRDFERALELDNCLFEARLNLRLGPGPGCRYTPEQQRALTAR